MHRVRFLTLLLGFLRARYVFRIRHSIRCSLPTHATHRLHRRIHHRPNRWMEVLSGAYSL